MYRGLFQVFQALPWVQSALYIPTYLCVPWHLKVPRTIRNFHISTFEPLKQSDLTGNCGAFVRLVSPRGGASANLVPICLPRGYPRAFHTYVFSYSKSNHGGFYQKGPAVRQRSGLNKLLEVFSISGISSLLIKAQLELSLYIARSGTINVNRRTHGSLIKD